MKTISVIATCLVGFVALQHLGFLTLQIFLWEDELGRRVFNSTPQDAAITATLAKQQGLYNGFLAAGLVWGLIARKADFVVFFLMCVIVAGVFGALTVSIKILFVQAAPALLALALTLMLRRQTNAAS